MDQDRTLILLAKYVAGEASTEELEELEWALLARPDLRRMAAVLQGLRQTPPKSISAEEEQQMLENGLKKMAREKDKVQVEKEKTIVQKDAVPMIYANPAPGVA